MNRLTVGIAFLTVGLSAAADVTADRFGALYFPDETAVFATDQSGAWCVSDWQGNACASGRVSGAAVAVPHADLDRRFGAFRLSVGTNETWFGFVRAKAVKPCGWVGVGTHASHGWYQQDYRYLDLMSAAGIGVVRDDVLWDWYEKPKGTYVFDSRLHGLVDELCKRGIRFHPVLNGKNALYANPLDPDGFAAFAAAFVTAFKGKVTSCDVFNEPHNFAFPEVYLPEGGSLEEWRCRSDAPWIPKHAEFTRKTVAAIKAVDATFSPGVGVEDYWAFFKTMLKGDLVREDDLVSIHPYDHEQPLPERNWLFKDNCREVRDYLSTYGGATRLAITECGWTTYDAAGASQPATSTGYPASTLVEQAQYLIRFWILARQNGIEFACQYDFKDDGTRRDYTEHNFGLVRQDYTPKPSFTALAAMTRCLGDLEPAGSVSSDETTYRYYDFSNATCRVSVAWSLEGTRTVAVPEGRSLDGVRCLDLQGNEIVPPVEGGQLRLTAAPIYLVEGDATGILTPAMVANVTVRQDAATHVVTANYDLMGGDAIVTAVILTNGVPCETTRHVSGDVWKVVPAGTGKTIAWNSSLDFGLDDVANYSVAVRVTAWATNSPPAYYVLDLVSGNRATTRRRYYEYEGQLPEGIGSDLYRTKKMVFRRIPAAGVSFTMGSPSAEWAASGFAKEPGTDAAMGYETQHTVTFTKDFYLGVFEVTKAQYRQVAGSLPTQSYTGSDADLCPVSNVRTWFEVRCNEGDCGCWPSDGRYPQNTHYLGKLRKMAGGTEVVYPNHTDWRAVIGKGYDLPTEAQWEFACRAGTTTAYNNGKDMSNNKTDSALDDIAWYAGTVGSESHVRPVGGKEPNAWGLYDMHGNVREWIIDSVEKYATGDAWYKENRTDPEGITYQGTRGMRGGGYDSNASGCRSAARYTHDWGGVGGGSIGFRVACPVDEL